ncbi:MAG: WHG domain-containing protein, partial [Leptospiraceae bacterium]|nr:WHG domain-containing protein [Leptospiraceae bacterium]
DDFEGRFFSLGWTYIQFTLKNPQYARIMFGGSSLNFEKYPELRVVSRRTYRQLRQLIHLGQDLSRITRGESREKTLAAWSVIHGVAMLFLEGRIKPGRNRKEVKEFVRSITKYVYLGMKL